MPDTRKALCRLRAFHSRIGQAVAFQMTNMQPPRDKFPWARFPRRLNLGRGSNKREGYLNVDLAGMHGPDLSADVRDLSMLPSIAGNFVDRIRLRLTETATCIQGHLCDRH